MRDYFQVVLKLFLVIGLLLFSGCRTSDYKTPNLQEISPPKTMRQGGKDHYYKRLEEIKALPLLEGGIILAGDSITEAWQWNMDALPVNEYDLEVSNHGVSWDTAEGLWRRLPFIVQHSPDYIFIKIGTNDIGYDHSAEHVARYVGLTLTEIKRVKPDAQIFLQAVLPREAEAMAQVDAYNQALEKIAVSQEVKFIDMSPEFSAVDGTLNSELTDDGLHLNAEGYRIWGKILTDIIKTSSNKN